MTLYMLRTRRGRVLVYNRPPTYQGVDKVWSERGQIHAFSERDSAPDWYDWVSVLRPEVPCAVHLLSPSVASRWKLRWQRDGDVAIVMHGHLMEAFCARFELRTHLPELHAGDSLSIVFGEELHHSSQGESSMSTHPHPEMHEQKHVDEVIKSVQAAKAGAPKIEALLRGILKNAKAVAAEGAEPGDLVKLLANLEHDVPEMSQLAAAK